MARDLVNDYDASGVQIKRRFTVAELEAELAAAKPRISELEQERELILLNKNYQLDALQAQLQAVSQQCAMAEKALGLCVHRAEMAEERLQAVTQERDTLLITNRETDAFANSKFGDVVAQLQAHNKELLRLLGNAASMIGPANYTGMEEIRAALTHTAEEPKP